MIIEIALITVQGGREADFEAAFPRAIAVLAASPGYRAHELHRSIETPSRFLLRIEWQTLEDHTVRFRASPRFAEWRAHIGPFFASPPVVEHFSAVAASR